MTKEKTKQKKWYEIINWKRTIMFFAFMTLFIMDMKLSASYEGCILLFHPYRVYILLASSLIWIIPLIFLRKQVLNFLREVILK